MAQGRIIAIGDIHGCGVALKTLLTSLKPREYDTIVVLGDAIDRGRDTCGVIDQLLALGEQCQLVPLLGNHEQMLLDSVDRGMPLQDWLIHGGAETLDSYGKDSALSEIPKKHLEFIRTWGDYYETATHFFAHGNYQSQKPLPEQVWEEMRWRSLHNFMPKPHVSGKIAVVGHTSNKQGQVVNLGHLICIDTYCYGGGWLTALDSESNRLWQANEAGESREGEMAVAR